MNRYSVLLLAVLLSQPASRADEPQDLAKKADEKSAQAELLERAAGQLDISSYDAQLLRSEAAALKAAAAELRKLAQPSVKETSQSRMATQRVEQQVQQIKQLQSRESPDLPSQLSGSDKRRALSRLADEKNRQAQMIEHMARQRTTSPEDAVLLWKEAAALRSKASELRKESLLVEQQARAERMAKQRADQEAAKLKKLSPR